jgi:hypothetical protein
MIIWLRNLLLSACSVGVILVAVIIPGTTAYAQEITATGADEAQFDGVIDNKYLAKPSTNKDSVTLTNPVFDGKIDNGDISAIQLYSQDELIRLINQNRHLQRVQDDRCQLVRDIQARAEILTIPSYQFLWGDMLAWGVCVNRDAELGIDYMRLAAAQGLPAAFEYLGRYHANGILVTQDTPLAVSYFKEAGALGSKPALIQLADLLIAGHGSPYDYENVYLWLYQTVSADKTYRNKVSTRMVALEQKMSPSVIKSARKVMRQY